MYTTGEEYNQKDGLGTEVVATATDNGEYIEIVAIGGKAGPMKTKITLEDDGRLKMAITLTDKEVTGIRYFNPVE